MCAFNIRVRDFVSPLFSHWSRLVYVSFWFKKNRYGLMFYCDFRWSSAGSIHRRPHFLLVYKSSSSIWKKWEYSRTMSIGCPEFHFKQGLPHLFLYNNESKQNSLDFHNVKCYVKGLHSFRPPDWLCLLLERYSCDRKMYRLVESVCLL
jgi:hypothetical protein